MFRSKKCTRHELYYGTLNRLTKTFLRILDAKFGNDPYEKFIFLDIIGQRVKVSYLMGINFDEKIFNSFQKFFLQELIFDIIQVSARLGRDK